MEQVALNNVQLDYLARDDPQLKPVFYGTVACDRLPKSPRKTIPQGYIVNTDPHDRPGQHWLAVWTDGNVCEVLDSCALPLERYEQAIPLREWIVKHWKYVVTNGKSLQAIYSKSCGDYTPWRLYTSYPVQYFGGGSFGMWQNRVYGKTLVREPRLV